MALSITERAAGHVQRSLARRGHGIGIRLAVRTSGCSGFAYALEYADAADDDDVTFIDHGVTILVDTKSLALLEGTELDFVREGLNEGFRFNNPNATATCGCGESFSV
jgi:iron-sulfur cluster assembly protein